MKVCHRNMTTMSIHHEQLLKKGMKSMNAKELKFAVESAKAVGWHPNADVDAALLGMDSPYKVFLAGKFQVGKSLLANKVYLNENGILRSGNGTMAMTCVVTELTYGEKSEMIVVYKDDTPDLVLHNPTESDVTKYTTADSEAERSALSRKIERVILKEPIDELRSYTVVDSPGIDDKNDEVLCASTLPQISKADAVVFVIKLCQLDKTELDFLGGMLFDKSISRIMIMISYNPAIDWMSEAARQEVISVIQSQLADIGRSYIPVEICCYDNMARGTLCTAESVRNAISKFAEKNVSQGRVGRIAHIVIEDITSYRNEIMTRLSINGKSADAVANLKRQIEDSEMSLSLKCTSTKSKIEGRTRELMSESSERIRTAIEAIKTTFVSKFESCSSLGEVKDILLHNEEMLQNEFRKALADEAETIKDNIEKVLESVDAELKNAASEISSSFDVNYDINTGWFGKLNSKVVIVADYLLVSILSPLGLIGDLILRYIAGKIPILKKILPAEFIKNQVISTISKSVDEIAHKVQKDFSAQLENCMKRIKEDIDMQFKKLYNITVAPMLKSIKENSSAKMTDTEEDQLKEACRKLDDLIEELSKAAA